MTLDSKTVLMVHLDLIANSLDEIEMLEGGRGIPNVTGFIEEMRAYTDNFRADASQEIDT